MLVTRILGDCPHCQRADSFGNVDVFGSELIRGCGCCSYSERVLLPPIRKKIRYLDQFFFSHAFRGSERRFVEACKRIEQVASGQLLAAPYSSLHEDETLFWSRRDELSEFIKRTSRGARFAPAYRVERAQLVRAFHSWLERKPAQYVVSERDAIDRDLHKWDGDFFIDVNRHPPDIDQMRKSKEGEIDRLLSAFDSWRSATSHFEDDVEAEHRAAAKGHFDAYWNYVSRAVVGDPSAMLDAPLMSMQFNARSGLDLSHQAGKENSDLFLYSQHEHRKRELGTISCLS